MSGVIVAPHVSIPAALRIRSTGAGRASVTPPRCRLRPLRGREHRATRPAAPEGAAGKLPRQGGERLLPDRPLQVDGGAQLLWLAADPLEERLARNGLPGV